MLSKHRFVQFFVNKVKVDHYKFESLRAGTTKAWLGDTLLALIYGVQVFECINYGMVYEMGFVTYPFE